MYKQIEVNWDNPSDIKKAISKLQFRRKNLLRQLGYDEIKFDGSKYNMDNLLPLFEDIWNTDLSEIYPNIGSKNYYVYAHCNPLIKLSSKKDIKQLFLAIKFNLEFLPFYIGKGTGNRFNELNRNDSHKKIRQSIKSKGKEIVPIKLIDNLTEGKALEYEAKLIDILGLISLSKYGLLVNLDESKESIFRRSLYTHPLAIKLLDKNGLNHD